MSLTVVVLPALAALVAATFAVQLARQYAARRKPHALAWALALALFGLASTAVTVGVGPGWSPAVFGVYWIAGALLNVPLLAVGQLLLLDPRRAALWWTVGGLAALWSVLFTVMAPFDTAVLADATAANQIPLGKEVLGGTTAYALIRPFNLTFLVVVVGSVWSAVRSRRWGVLLIALGVTIAAAGSSFVRVGNGEWFSILLAAGVTVMYGGFLAAARPPKRVTAPAHAQHA